ncbi:MAG: Cthe_2314 family HEPN domain-containing protein [Candidatus Thorarchaeota archaeon]
MAEITEVIDALLEKSKAIKSKSRREKIKLYCEGLKAKLEQVSFALSSIDTFTNRSDGTESTTEEDAPSISMQVAFYCDTFWIFLYSTLDVLSQIVNQAMALELDERNVSFNQVKGKLSGNALKAKDVSKKYDKCSKSRAFKNLEKYRNCSIHRRQIYIEEICETKSVRRTAGYTAVSTTESSSTVVTRILCDDPLTQNPKTSQERKIPKYMVDIKDSVIESIIKILKAVELKK